MKICKFESYTLNKNTVTLYYRIERGPGVQKAFNRLKNHIREGIGFEEDLPKGVIGKNPDALPFDRSMINGKGCHVNAIKSEHYMHIIASVSNEVKPEFVKAMLMFFKNI